MRSMLAHFYARIEFLLKLRHLKISTTEKKNFQLQRKRIAQTNLVRFTAYQKVIESMTVFEFGSRSMSSVHVECA